LRKELTHLVEEYKNRISNKEVRTFQRLEELLGGFWRKQNPAKQIQKIIISSLNNKNRVSVWKRRVLSLTAMCKLLEEIIQVKLPGLPEANNRLPLNSFEYSTPVLKYLHNETISANNKAMTEYKRMSEILLFEQYSFYYL
jgi:hypothetical protein